MDDAGYGFATTSTKRYSRQNSRQRRTPPRICDVRKAPPPLCHRKATRERAYRLLFQHPGKYRKLGCTISNQPLGTDYETACGENGNGGRAAALNQLSMNGTRNVRPRMPHRRTVPIRHRRLVVSGIRASKAYLEKVSQRSRPDYERTMLFVDDILTKKGDRIGDRLIRSITPRGADKIYEKIIFGPMASDCGKARKLSLYAARHGALCDVCIPTNLTRRCRTRGGRHTRASCEEKEASGHARSCLCLRVGLH